ncbi:ERCC6 [Lepeophtheirus salmonis]|uniref:DNA repair and recombination protein RAD54-like n=1 Tax=Lepeophtheirus salmonis TaxID=72036 RepID=A0A7R8D4P9_LEPSM|nr:ERCC6 [Lepeophtheirus salmonis]CAF2996780.1 ERCC6 [Lepeophtheirus salmonis]
MLTPSLPLLAKCLRPYQIDGIRFLYGLYSKPGVNGGLLADEMGLGKTIQVIGFLASLSNKTNIGVIDGNLKRKIRGRYLLVSPASIIYNWESELQTWSYFSIGLYYGPNRKKEILYNSPEKYEIILTSYDILREDIDIISSLFPWKVIILDEIHRLKDPNGRNHKVLKSYLSSIPLKIGLAGVLLQNKYQELWALLEWVNPGCLGTWKDFNAKYSRPIELGLRLNATTSQLARARLLQRDFDILKDEMILRRMKKDKFVDLPLKLDKIIYSNHVGLLSPKFNQSSKTQREFASRAISQVVSDFYKEIANHSFLSLADTRYSGKMVVLADLLTALKKEQGNKLLLFSYSTKVLNILEQFIKLRAYDYRRIDGATPAKTRFSIVNEFNEHPNIFVLLLSTKAGGLGLNITGANVVIIYDPNWNPSHDLQAQDRAYRIGQTKDVRVFFRLITSGCIEENIYLRQLYKQQLCSNAVDCVKVKRYFQGSPNFDKREVFETIFKRNKEMEQSFKGNKYHIEDFELDPKRLFEGKDDPFLIDVDEEDSDEKIISNYQKKKSNATEVDSVLSSKNILHVHENNSVIGGSREEEKISECAIQENKGGKVEPSISKSVVIIPPLRHLKAYNDKIFCTTEGTIFYGQTPNAVKKKDFSKMRELSELSEKEFATKIIEMQPFDLAKFLQGYYISNRNIQKCEDIFNVVIEEIKKEELELMNQKNKIASPNVELLFKSRKRKTPVPEDIKTKKTIMSNDTNCSKVINNYDTLFPPDDMFDIADEDCTKGSSKEIRPLNSNSSIVTYFPDKSRSKQPTKRNPDLFSEPFDDHFFDTNTAQMCQEASNKINQIKESDIEEDDDESLEETQFNLPFKPTKLKDHKEEEKISLFSQTETSIVESQSSPHHLYDSESILSLRSPRPPPDGIFYTQKHRHSPEKCSNMNDDFYNDVLVSQTMMAKDSIRRSPQFVNEKKESCIESLAPIIDTSTDSQFFDSIFTSSDCVD